MKDLNSSSAYQHFFVPKPSNKFFYADLELVLPSVPEEYRQLAEAFRKNLFSLVSVASLPFTMAFLGIRNTSLFRLRVLEILGGPAPSSHATPEETRKVAEETLCFLEDFVSDKESDAAATELIRQSIVQTWSVLEVFASDSFIALLNNNPNLIDALLKDERTKKRFQLKDPIAMFQEHGYDLSKCVGTILAEHHKIDDIETIRTVYDVILPEYSELRKLLLRDELWALYQRRNLIIHRRSIVDRAYLKNTGDKLPLGSELQTTPNELRKYILAVSETGTALLKALTCSQKLKLQSAPQPPTA